MRKSKKIVATALSAAMAAPMCVAVPATAAFAEDGGGVIADQGTEEAIPFDESTMHSEPDQFYTGKEIKPYSETWNAKGSWEKLTEGVDYTVKYDNNVKKGSTATATITGIGKYSGTIIKTFKIIEFYINVSYVDAEGKETSLGTLDKTKVDQLVKESVDNTESRNYMYGSAGKYTVMYVPAKSYLTYNSIMRAVGVSSWKSASGVGTDNFAGSPITYEMNSEGKFFPATTKAGISAEGAYNVPAAITFANSTVSLEDTAAQAAEAAAKKDVTEEVKLAVGGIDENVESNTIMGKLFAGSVYKFIISDYTMLKANTLKVGKAKVTVKKGKKATVKVKKAKGAVSVASSAKKIAKATYSKKTGKVTIKALKKGKATITVTAAGNSTYKAGSKTIKVTVK